MATRTWRTRWIWFLSTNFCLGENATERTLAEGGVPAARRGSHEVSVLEDARRTPVPIQGVVRWMRSRIGGLRQHSKNSTDSMAEILEAVESISSDREGALKNPRADGRRREVCARAPNQEGHGKSQRRQVGHSIESSVSGAKIAVRPSFTWKTPTARPSTGRSSR